jgi:ABC-2 type transport system permease protein
MMEEMKSAYYIARKDVKAYYLKPPMISWGLMLPVVFILAFYFKNPRDIQQVAPGLVGLTLLFSATSMAAIVITFEKRTEALERLLLAPVSLRTILLGKTAGSAFFGLVMGFLSLVMVMLLFGMKATRPVSLILAMVISAVVFALIGILISVGVREVFEAMTMANFFRFPMVFLCGVFFPVSAMPAPLQGIAFCLPLTYSVDALHSSLLGDGGLLHPWLDLLMLLGFCLFLFFATQLIFAKRIQEEY